MNCSVCVHEKRKEIDLALLTATASLTSLVEKFSLQRWVLKEHRRKHLPWISPRRKPAETITEKMEELSAELKRLQVLGELGMSVTKPLAVLRQRQSLLELEMRMGHMVSTHRKQLPAKAIDEGSFEVKFRNGIATTVEVGAK